MYSGCLVVSEFVLRKINSGVWFVQTFYGKSSFATKIEKTRGENLINHSTASNGKVRVIQFNPIPHSHFPTNQIDPQKKQNPEKNSSNPINEQTLRERQLGSI